MYLHFYFNSFYPTLGSNWWQNLSTPVKSCIKTPQIQEQNSLGVEAPEDATGEKF